MAIAQGATVTELPDREPIEAKVARIDESVQNIEQAVSEVKIAQTQMLDAVGKRFTYLEEVRVRAIEDQQLAERVREDERQKTAKEQAKVQASAAAVQAAASSNHLTAKQFWIGIGATVTVGIFGSLIEAHLIF